MKISVNKIPAEGCKQHATYDPTEMDMDRTDVHLKEPFDVDAFITKADRELIVDVEICAPLHLACARCLEEFPWTARVETLFSYHVQPTDVVDIAEDVRQEIILAYPTIPICRPNCKGLCSTCGQDLNLAMCAHQAAAGRSHEEPRGGSLRI